MSTVQEIERLVAGYQAWLKDKTRLRELGEDWVEITTPYLDRHNDAIQLYVRADNGRYTLTDDSYTLRDLESSGCKLDTPKRQELLNTTLNGFGVHLSEEALVVHASATTFPAQKHSLVQAMLAVNDLFYLASPHVQNLFFEDVVAWLDQQEVRYIPKAKFTGISGFDHLFDFVIPKSPRQQRPERILKAITRPNRNSAEAFIHAWSDTREVRPTDSQAYAILNDLEEPVSPSVLDALSNYRIRPVPFSRRSEFVAELAA